MDKKPAEQYSDLVTANRMDRALKRSLEMKPAPHTHKAKPAKAPSGRVIRAKPTT